MSREQIEEISKILCGMKNGCDGCMFNKVHCNERNYAEEIYNAGYRKMPENMGEFSDGYHTFNELYHHRAVLFSVICNMFPEKAWKSKKHDTGDMYEGMFIVGIETEQGQATYHYDIEPYWDIFKVKELEYAPKYDGHTPSDAISRIGNISVEGYRKQSENVIELPCKVGDAMYVTYKGIAYPVRVNAIRIDTKKNNHRICVSGTFHLYEDYDHNYKATFPFDSIGKSLFYTEAEAKMKGENK